jgi:hypothetical protein
MLNGIQRVAGGEERMETNAFDLRQFLQKKCGPWQKGLSCLFTDAPLLSWGGLAFGTLALLCLAALAFEAQPVLGLHPALKPLKFSLSIALFLFSVAALFPYLSTPRLVRRRLEGVLLGTMVLEIVVIGGQALRGTTSHFNTSTWINGVGWMVMGLAILLNSLTMAGVAVLATVRPLVRAGQTPLAPVQAFAWRAGLWLFLFAVVSGFLMAHSSRHTFAGLGDVRRAVAGHVVDGGPGLPFVNWSTQAGDLRVSHFFSLHALQFFPLVALLFARALPRQATALTRAFVLIYGVVCVATFAQALLGIPLLGASLGLAQNETSGLAAPGSTAALLSDQASGLLFQWANILVMPFWLLMIFAPRWRGTARVMNSHLAPALPALVYAVLVIPSLSSLLPVLANPKPEVIGAMLGSPQGLAIAWLHFLAFDLFVGRFIWLRLKEAPLPTPALSVILFATLMFGPLGYLLFLIALTFVVRAEAVSGADEAAELGAEKQAAVRGTNT